MDLIDRQSVLKAIDEYERLSAVSQTVRNMTSLMEIVQQLPSVQPETHDKRTETHACDCIGRQGVLKILTDISYNHCPTAQASEAVDLAKTMVAVMPETNVHDLQKGADCISRQAAIDTVRHAWAKGLEPSQYIEELPSAQPEPKWIPCSERLPEESGLYIVTNVGRWVEPVGTRYYNIRADGGFWSGHPGDKVLAWMPLPEVFKEATE